MSFQVETGVAKMNRLTTAAASEPQLVTTVTKTTSTRGNVATGSRLHTQMMVANIYSAGVPTLVMNMMGGGRTNPAGPQTEQEDRTRGGGSTGEDGRLDLLNSSPDEHEPLLRREEQPAQSQHLLQHHQSPAGRGSNFNNNNSNKLPLGSEVKISCLNGEPERMMGSEVSPGRGTGSAELQLQSAGEKISGSAATTGVSNQENKTLLSGPADQAASSNPPPTKDLLPASRQGSDAGTVFAPAYTEIPTAPLVRSDATAPVSDQTPAESSSLVPEDPQTRAQHAQNQNNSTSGQVSPNDSTLERPAVPASPEYPGAPPQEDLASENTEPVTPAFKYQGSRTEALAVLPPGPEASAPEPAALQVPATLDLQTEGLLRPQVDQASPRRPERPCSLDLSSLTSSGKSRLMCQCKIAVTVS